jgi:NAD(P)-dependent dehydrogenase (short-subunit alcohol dehydrogenase family)
VEFVQMSNEYAPEQLFSLKGKVAVVTGGTGVLGGAMAHGLAAAGAKVAILGRRAEVAEQVAEAIKAEGGEAMPLPADVLDKQSLEQARTALLSQWGTVDILINAAGGTVQEAIIVGERTFFDMSETAWDQVVALNLTGTLLPSQVFCEVMAQNKSGVVVNISSMSAQKPLTRVLGYGVAKSAIDNYTKWLAVEFANKYGAGLRVNAIAPGFFLGDQNRALLINPDKTPTGRGQLILDHTPMKRFGEPEELIGATVWLCSDAARFVTGIVVAIDGGFMAFSGV